MKKFQAIVILIIYGLSFGLMSCSNDDENTNDSNQSADQTIAQVEDTVEAGTWRISKYIDSGDDETNDYNGFSFSFNADGTLDATNDIMTVSGIWSVTDSSSNSSDDSSDDDDVDFNIFFASPALFSELSDDWDILSRTASKLELKDVSGGNGGTDLLTFVKN
ncbi:MAG: hypothetical protein ABJM06_03205 [Gilvibacter sp.]